jgi:hypothetical protein
MIVSRAFADFARWQVPVGWGADKDVDVSGLRTAGRSKGRSGCQRRRAAAAFHRQRQALGVAGVARWLGKSVTGDRGSPVTAATTADCAT